jgi:hypothetical protein
MKSTLTLAQPTLKPPGAGQPAPATLNLGLYLMPQI